MTNAAQPLVGRQSGFSLTEILVGLAIGLLVTLVIMQVFSVFEGQKRTTTGTSDALVNGSTALYAIEREAQLAGFGLVPAGSAGVADSPLECTSLTIDAATGFSPAAGVSALSPVVIIDGGTAAGASDTITLHYGNSGSGGIPVPLALPLVAGASAVATVDNNMGCPGTNVALMVFGPACYMTVAAQQTPANTTELVLNDAAVAVPDGMRLACLGTWTEAVYAVNRVNNVSTLTRNGDPVIADIVNIQAQYGISAAGLANNNNDFNKIVQWVDAVSPTWAAPTVADRNRIKAIRIAVVARNGLREKDIVTNAATIGNTCTTNKGTVNKGPCAWDDANVDAAPKIDLSNDPDWPYYRYRVFETIIPLRNVIWYKSTL